MKEGRKPEYLEKTHGDELQKLRQDSVKSWYTIAPDVIGSEVELAGSVPAYFD